MNTSISKNPKQIINKLKELGDAEKASHSQGFFKTGKAEYGEGDRFLGIRVPVIRKCAKEHFEISLDDTLNVLASPFHEARLLALMILVKKYSIEKTAGGKNLIYRSYLKNTKYINNWDLVDLSAEHIVGAHLFSRDRKQLYRLARSKDLWERRISVISTFHFIRKGDFADTIKIAGLLLDDRHDLIHKAVGWMLREVGKRHLKTEEDFLKIHYRAMPRTMLRYAIERFPETKRKRYLKGTI